MDKTETTGAEPSPQSHSKWLMLPSGSVEYEASNVTGAPSRGLGGPKANAARGIARTWIDSVCDPVRLSKSVTTSVTS